jgi:hypothetical protein
LHNFLKKNLNETETETETGRRMFICLYELAKKENHEELIKFASEVLEIYDKHRINGHIIGRNRLCAN